MRNFLTQLGGTLLASAAAVLFVSGVASAETSHPEVSEAKRQSISANCSSIRSTLTQLHTTDALLRVNRGQLYTSLSTNVMAKLNSRIALNRLDGSELVKVTTVYENNYSNFREAYQTYNDSIEKLRKTDCNKEPQQFYHALLDSRQYRAELNETTKYLNDDILAYQSAFRTFKADFLADKKGKND